MSFFDPFGVFLNHSHVIIKTGSTEFLLEHFGLTAAGIAAAARYLSTSDYKGKVMLTGLGTPNQMREYVEDGTVEAFALWNPADLGYLAAFAAQALVNGDITGAEGDVHEGVVPVRAFGITAGAVAVMLLMRGVSALSM